MPLKYFPVPRPSQWQVLQASCGLTTELRPAEELERWLSEDGWHYRIVAHRGPIHIDHDVDFDAMQFWALGEWLDGQGCWDPLTATELAMLGLSP